MDPPPPLRRSNNSAGPPPRLNRPRPDPRPPRLPSPRVFGENEPLPPPPRLQRADATQLHLSAHEIEEILRRSAVSQESVRRLMPDIRALSPSQRTHVTNRLMNEFIVSDETNQLFNGKMKSKRRKLKKGVSRKRRSRK